MIGRLSGRYESNNDVGCVSDGDGDLGGPSFGIHQFSSTMGVADAFAQWLADENAYPFSHILVELPAGSFGFNDAWKAIAEEYPAEFEAAQHQYSQEQYFDPAADLLAEIGFDIRSRSEALQEVLFARAIQHGARWMPELFTNAAAMAGKELNDCTDEELITNAYEVELTDLSWTSGSPSQRPGLFARFENERRDALNLLNGGELA